RRAGGRLAPRGHPDRARRGGRGGIERSPRRPEKGSGRATGARLTHAAQANTRQALIRYIRVLGAALGGIVGITLIIEQIAVFQGAPGEGALAVAWVIAWTVLGFSLLPHLTVIPAMGALRAV